VGVVVQVGAAEAGALDGDLDFVCGGGGEVASLLWVMLVLCGSCIGMVPGGLTIRRSLAPWRTLAWTLEAIVEVVDRLRGWD